MPAHAQFARPFHAPQPPAGSRTVFVVLGIVLAGFAVLIVVAVVAYTMRNPHHPVKVVDDRPRDAGQDDDDGGPEPAVTPAPTLSVEPSSKPWPKSPDGGTWDPCASLRRARERGDAGAATLERLEHKCREKGGL
jgi:hypothetical protein